MEELEQKLQHVLEVMNTTFDIAIDQTEEGVEDEKVITKIVLKKLNNDGSDFVEAFCSLFGPVVEQVSNGTKEFVYEEGTGLKIKNIK